MFAGSCRRHIGFTDMPNQFTDDQLLIYANRVKGKVVVITGGASGIGRESAKLFAKHGSKVVIGDMNAVDGAAVAKAITKEGGEATFIKCDVTNWDEQVAMFERAIERFGTVDIVIPNAGINESEEVCWGNLKFVDGKPAEPQLLTVKVNLIGVLYTTHLAMYYMKLHRSPGAWKSLVIIGSMASWIGLFAAQQYTASKHAVLGLIRSLDPVVESENIRTACIHPWFTDTNILDWQLRTLVAGIPMTPLERVAGAIFRAATDPDPTTSGCAWLLPDDGPVLLLRKEDMREGVYDVLNKRVRRIMSFRSNVLLWLALFRDIGRVLRPVLVSGGIVGLATALYLRS
ncbi:NAD(P)-binding protein [Russula earlei]|uniref:NAD(P)-binding protein n=1 Tax=Russula earlei TaxID=71964 RepID=A0ACC0U0K2_9AGAM|nr:NAD(P)-binding protein [Russula earlei]